RLGKHPQPSPHHADHNQHHRGTHHHRNQRDPCDAPLAEVFEDEMEFVQGVSRNHYPARDSIFLRLCSINSDRVRLFFRAYLSVSRSRASSIATVTRRSPSPTKT